ncbi:MAG: hypothetical protein ACFE0O_15795 [Opitutales bacterium]
MQPNSIATVGFGFSRKKAPEPVYGSGVIEPPARHSLGDGGWVWEDAFGAGGAPHGAQALLARGKRVTTGFSYLTTALGVNVDEDTDIEAARFIRLRSGGAMPDRPGKPYDQDREAHVFPYRNDSSDLGRWTSADPLGFPDGPNRHFYAPVPTMGLDPLGLLQIDSGLSDNYSSSSEVLANVSPSQSGIDGPPTNDQITDGFTSGSGPQVVFRDFDTAAGGYHALTDAIYIDTDLLQAVEDGTTGAELLLEVTIGHEMAHYFDDLDGSDTPGEEGNAWEIDVFGSVIDWYNVNSLGPWVMSEL